MQLNSPIPPCLAKHGITGVRDNLLPGQAVGGFAKELVRLFGPELLEALRCDKPDTDSSSDSRSKRLPAS